MKPLVSTLFVDKIMKRKINFLVKMCKNINSIAATVAIKYAVDELDTKTVDVSIS